MSATIAGRAALRAAVAQALRTGVPSAGGRVLVGRAWPQPGAGQALPHAFPALLVQDGPRILSATAQGFAVVRCQMRVIARVQDRDDAARDAALDALDAEIRTALRGDAALAALVLLVEEIASDREVSVEGQATMAEESHMVTFRMAGFA
jgi:hypothetical protein